MDRWKSEELKERIFGLIPTSHIGYSSLLGLLDIGFSDDVETAAVDLGRRGTMRINPGFLEKHCFTDERLMMLVLHELMHVLLGHTRLYRRVTTAQNIAFDAVINAHLCHLLPEPEYTAFFRDLYRDDRLPEALLRPPAGWSDERPEWKLTGEALSVHRALYGRKAVDTTTMEVLQLVERVVAQNCVAVFLLGSHGREADGEAADPDLMRKIRELVAEWPRDLVKSGRDDGGRTNEERIALEKAQRRVVATIRRALLSLVEAFGLPVRRFQGEGALPALLPWRTTTDRRGIVAEQLPGAPLRVLWSGQLSGRRRTWHEVPTVYIDVSGSMSHVLPMLYAALLPLRQYIAPQVVLFSTELERIPFARLKEGVVCSTYGTHISCVTQDIVDRGIRKALILTDGWVGDIPRIHRRKLRRVELAAVITDPGDDAWIRTVGGRVFRLPERFEANRARTRRR